MMETVTRIEVTSINDTGTANASLSISSAEKNDSIAGHPSFTSHSLNVVIVYCVLFVVAAVGNLTVFISLFRSRRRKSRISLMIKHLAIADMVVTFVMIPLEVGWRITVQWMAGNVACKFFLFLRAFGLYLSSNVLVCVSLDRYFAVLHPLKVNDARRRGKLMLVWAWSISIVYSLPQSIVFHVAAHPNHSDFQQCVTFGFFKSQNQEIAYNVLCLVAMYFIPFIVIVVAYTAIMCEISKKSKETTNGDAIQGSNGRLRLRRSDISNIERARTRTLRMTVTIVVAFVICWTPYVVMTLWYMFDRDGAARLPAWLQDTLFMMAVSNSCMNPLVYGSYAINLKSECLRCLLCCHQKISHRNGALNSGVTRSTAMMHGIVRGSGIRGGNHMIGLLPSKEWDYRSRSKSGSGGAGVGAAAAAVGVGGDVLVNGGGGGGGQHVSFLSEPLPSAEFHASFHSEPGPRGAATYLENSVSQGSHCTDDPLLSDAPQDFL